jgi:hypothetical protein
MSTSDKKTQGTDLSDILDKLESLAVLPEMQRNMEEMQQSMKKMQQNMKEMKKEMKDIKSAQEQFDWRLKAKETFPAPPNAAPPQQANIVTQGSVSNPTWSKRSIFG